MVNEREITINVEARDARARRILLALVILFFLSGICGLIYQVVWMRLLALVFGVTTYAAATVLASFMAGLALGSFGAGKWADRARNPILGYAVAEVLIGMSALATPTALNSIESIYAKLHPSMQGSLALLTAGRFTFSFAVLIVPTTLMGATLPIVVKSALFKSEGLGERAGLLYASNTAGAIVGAVTAGFFLIGTIGLVASTRAAAALNLLVGVVAVLVWRVFKQNRTVTDERVTADDAASEVPIRVRRLVLIVFALSGFAALALEIVWFRLLVLFIEVTTYAFTTMLAVVLLGIAAGSYLIAPFMRRQWNWLKVLAVLELAIALVSLLSLAALGMFYGSISGDVETGRIGPMIAVSCILVLPAALLMGVAFPIGLRLWAGGGARSGEHVAVFYSVNVAGAILGSLAGGFVLLPQLGSRGSLICSSVISLISGLLLLASLERFPKIAGPGAVVVFVLVSTVLPDPFAVALEHRYRGEELIWKEEGIQTTVSLHRRNGSRVLYLDGLPQATDSADQLGRHRRMALLPAILHRNPKDVLVIGLGSGMSSGALSSIGLSLDVIELSESVVRSAELLRDINQDVLRRPSVNLRIDDGRNYMLLTPRRYDLITADVIRPFHVGAGNVYSVEYFKLARARLKDDGIMLQWLGRLSEERYRLIMRTFLSAFPDATLWVRGTMMVGTKRPLEIDQQEFELRLKDPDMREALGSIGIDRFASLLSLYTAGPEEMQAFVGAGPILTDDRPMVEYFLSLSESNHRVERGTLQGDVMRHVRRP